MLSVVEIWQVYNGVVCCRNLIPKRRWDSARPCPMGGLRLTKLQMVDLSSSERLLTNIFLILNYLLLLFMFMYIALICGLIYPHKSCYFLT